MFTPAFSGELLNIYLKSGKGVNQLGDPDACPTDTMEYIIIAAMTEEGFAMARIGI